MLKYFVSGYFVGYKEKIKETSISYAIFRNMYLTELKYIITKPKL